MTLIVEIGGKRYSVTFFRTGSVSVVKVWTQRNAWTGIWNSFSNRTPGPRIQAAIQAATAMRETSLASAPRFPLMS